MSRPRSRLGLSSMHRRSSSGSVPKVDLHESPQDKARYKINTKADPTMAMSEAQPAQLQALAENTISSLRSLEHRDADGNLITDPDRSNPTRPRLERPLDTIRSFEAAIDGSYNRRQSYVRAESAGPVSTQNRRSSYFNGYQSAQPQHRNGHNGNGNGYNGGDGAGYYNHNPNRNSMNFNRSENYADNYGPSPSQHSNPRRFGPPRNHSDPALYGRNADAGVYQSHGHQQSYDTVGTTSNGSHFTDQWGNSTDPSSENSSIDKYQAPPPPPPKPDLSEVYGFSGFGGAPQFQGPILEEYSHDTPAYGEGGYNQPHPVANQAHNRSGREAPPSVPAHRVPMPPPKEPRSTRPTKMERAPPPSNPLPRSDSGEKRKSWLKRRFSRN